jgi:hypothetical protein
MSRNVTISFLPARFALIAEPGSRSEGGRSRQQAVT